MTDLIKMIETEIMLLNKAIDNLTYNELGCTDHHIWQAKISTLKQVLSELKKRNCEGCKYNDSCSKTIKNNNDMFLTYCSNWEAK